MTARRPISPLVVPAPAPEWLIALAKLNMYGDRKDFVKAARAVVIGQAGQTPGGLATIGKLWRHVDAWLAGERNLTAALGALSTATNIAQEAMRNNDTVLWGVARITCWALGAVLRSLGWYKPSDGAPVDDVN